MRVKNLTMQCIGARNLMKSHFNTLNNNEICPDRINDLTQITCVWEENASPHSESTVRPVVLT